MSGGQALERDWSADALDYGYVLWRLESGEWWHCHIGRSGLEYECELLGRRTNLLVQVVKYAAGCNPRSGHFVLTLDGEGIEDATRIDFRWTKGSYTNPHIEPGWATEAEHIQEFVIPLLLDGPEFGWVLWYIINHQQYPKIAERSKFVPAL